MAVIAFIVHRFGYMLITMAIVSVLGFIIINLPPGTYLDVRIAELESQGTSTAAEQIRALESRYGLDLPLYQQYFKWITGFIKGDFGRSFQFNQEVKDLIGDRLLLTIVVATATLIFSWVVALPIGIYSAVNQYSKGDNFFTFLGFLGLSIPNFLLALILLVLAWVIFDVSLVGLFSREMEDAPWSFAKFVDLLKHLWIPVLVVGTEGTAGLIRVMRGNLLDILNMQYVMTARAKGLEERVVIYKHAVRNAIHPLIMQLGLSLPSIISGSTVVAIVLSLPITGSLYFNALRAQDMYLAGTFLMFLAIMLIIGNFIADLLLAWVDPRIRFD